MELSVLLSKSSCFETRPMTSFFRRARFCILLYQQKAVLHQQKASKNEMLKQIGISTDRIYQPDFLKVAISNN